MPDYPRFHPVRISRYIGVYTNRDADLCWAVADRDHANRIHDGRKFDTREQAQQHAEVLSREHQTS